MSTTRRVVKVVSDNISNSSVTMTERGKEKHTGRLETGTTNKEAINISLLGELTAVLLAHRATVNDSGVLGGLGGDGILQPLANGSVDFLGLLGRSDLTRADGPIIPVRSRARACARERFCAPHQTGS
jgi:hypothetical protein